MLCYKFVLLRVWATPHHSTPLECPACSGYCLTETVTHACGQLWQCSQTVHRPVDLLLTSCDCALLAAGEASASDSEEEENEAERYIGGGGGGGARLARRSEEVLSQGTELNKAEGGQHWPGHCGAGVCGQLVLWHYSITAQAVWGQQAQRLLAFVRRLSPISPIPLPVTMNDVQFPPAPPTAAIVEFQYEEKAMADQLGWLVRGAARLKAFLADTALWLEETWSSRQLPRGLLETFPQSVLQVGEAEAAGAAD